MNYFLITTLATLAWRNLWRNYRRTLITLSMTSIGFALVIFFIGLGDGSHNSMIRNAINLGQGHISIAKSGYHSAPANHKFMVGGVNTLKTLQQEFPKLAIYPRIDLYGLANTAHNTIGVQLQNWQADDPRIEFIKKHLSREIPETLDDFKVMIGKELAKKLKVRLGSKIILTVGLDQGESSSQLVRVAGIFSTQLTEYDKHMIFANQDLLQSFFANEGMTLPFALSQIAIYLDDTKQLSSTQSAIIRAVDDPSIAVLSWEQSMPELLKFIALDDAGNYVFLVIIIIMVIVGTINTILMSVLERTREFGLLRALGLAKMKLLGMVFAETFLLSLLALTFGWILGGLLHAWFSNYGLDFSAFTDSQIAGAYMDPIIYSELSWQRVFNLSWLIVVTIWLAGVYPALKVIKVTPVQALKT